MKFFKVNTCQYIYFIKYIYSVSKSLICFKDKKRYSVPKVSSPISFQNKYLKLDLFSASREKHSCHCGKEYSHQSALWNHKRYNCGKEPEFLCPFCERRISRKGNFKRHVLLRHPEMAEMNFDNFIWLKILFVNLYFFSHLSLRFIANF